MLEVQYLFGFEGEQADKLAENVWNVPELDVISAAHAVDQENRAVV